LRNRKGIERLKEVRTSAAIAVSQGSETSRAKTFHELEAAMLAIEDRFAIPRLSVPEHLTAARGHKEALEVYVGHVLPAIAR
jgi:hypothetical protein